MPRTVKNIFRELCPPAVWKTGRKLFRTPGAASALAPGASASAKLTPDDQAAIARVVEDPTPPNTSRSEAAFEMLQGRWPLRSGYGYDPRSTWVRGVERSVALVMLEGLGSPGKRVLDLGAGDGMLGVAIASFGHEVVLFDEQDWRDDRARSLQLETGDCCRHLPFANQSFDLVCSYNTFEHLADPAAAMKEIVRILRPHGLLHLDFGPLYLGPWGLHAYRSLRMPYPQHLFSRDFVEKALEKIGIWDLGRKRDKLQFLSCWRVRDFQRLWAESGCAVLRNTIGSDECGLSLILEFPEAFRGRGLSLEDLAANQITITLRKP